MLKTWIGNRPPSGEFKNAILASGQDIDETLLERYNSLQPQAKRQVPLANKRAEAEKKAALAAAKAKAAAEKAKAEAKARAEKLAQEKKLAAEKAKQAQQAKAKAEREAKQKQAAEAAAALAAAAEKAKQSAAALARTSAAKATDAVIKTADKATAKAEPVPQPEPQVQATPAAPTKTPAELQQQGLSNAYQAYVQRRIYQHLVYPNKAYKKGLQGTVIANLKIGRSGQIESLELNSNAHSLLQQAAREAVNKAAPFAAIPSNINADELALDISLNFKLPPS